MVVDVQCGNVAIPANESENPLSVTDLERLERLRTGDHAAYEEIFRTYYGSLVGFAERMLGGRGNAEETVQDVMLAVWQRRESLSVGSSLRAYLFRATRNRVLNEIRHDRIVRASAPMVREEANAAPSAAAGALEREIDEAVQMAMAALPPRCREVFELSRAHGLRYGEIAETLGISVKTVEAQMGKALRLLRERLEPWLG